MKNPYQKLTDHIQPPDGLNERVLAAVREAPAAEQSRRPARRWVRVAVCAACALALVLGTWTFYPDTDGETDADGAPVAALPSFSFGLTAYAADTGENIAPNANGGVAFAVTGDVVFSNAGEASMWRSGGCYTGCLFQVTGENIDTVTLSVDRGGLYRYAVRTGLTKEEIDQYRLAMEEGTMAAATISQGEDGTWYMPEMTPLGASVTEDYDPEASYGFWVPEEQLITDPELDVRETYWANVDLFDGARLTVTVTFADGTEQTRIYTLSTGRIQVEYGPEGIETLPQLAGDDAPYIYGIYAESQEESRYFQWPVQGANTVRTSNSYGGRWQPGGQRQIFHYGIDVPAEEGTPILAAADGTVAEIGFDPERGNYILLDHGGGLATLYGQCRDILDTLAEGDTVQAGEMIAAVGSTGMSTGPHLHFEVLQDGEPQNPVAYFDSTVRDTLWMA